MRKSVQLREMILSDKLLVMPNAYDALTAKIIESTGFSGVQCSGYSISLSKQLKDENLLSRTDNLKITSEIVKSVDIPVMADGEDGYDNLGSLEETINKFINIGCAGINIEDRCIEPDKMLNKIEIIKRTISRSANRDFVLNARTDALLNNDRKKGQADAIKRANLYLENGADLAFICFTKTLEEVKLFAKEINGPISIAAGQPYNIQEFSIQDCQDLGVARVSLPTLLINSVTNQLTEELRNLKEDYSFTKLRSK